jgi:hypothetical protein
MTNVTEVPEDKLEKFDDNFYNELMNWNHKKLNIELLTIMYVPTLVDVNKFQTLMSTYLRYNNKYIEDCLIKNGFPKNVNCHLNWNYYGPIYIVSWEDSLMADNKFYKDSNDKCKKEER